MNLSDLVNEYKRAGYDKYRLSGGQLIDEGGQVMMNATPEDIQRYKEYQHAQFAAGNEPDPVPRAAPRPMATKQLRLADLMADNSEAGVTFAQPDPYENETRRLLNYGTQPEAIPAPQDPANVRLSKMMSGGTTGGWSNQNGRRTLTMQGGPRVEPPSPQKLVEQQFQQEAMRVLQDPAIPMAQKIDVYKAMNKGQDLDSVLKGLQIKKAQQDIDQGPIAPAGYRSNPDGSMSFIPGGPADPSMRSVNKPMSTTAQKELIESDESIQGGNAAIDLLSQAQKMNESAMGFKGAGALASMGTVLPDGMRPESVDATLNLDNILQSQALPQLKSIFGGMPTEGERKILLDIQGSSSQPAKVRAEIFKRAEKAIQNRLAFSKDKSQRLRAGTYFSGDGMANQQPSQRSGGPMQIRSEAEASNLPKGTIVIINGRRAVVE